MALKIIYNHNLLPEEVYHSPHPNQFLGAFMYNSQRWILSSNYKKGTVTISSGDISHHVETHINEHLYEYQTEMVEYSDTVLWIGIKYQRQQSKFYLVDMQTLKTSKYICSSELIHPIGSKYLVKINKNSSVGVYDWKSLILLTREPPVPLLVGEPGTKYFPVSWSGASYVSVHGKTLDFLNNEFELMFSTRVESFFPSYTKLTRTNTDSDMECEDNTDDQEFNEPDYLISIHDNCLLYYEWFDVIDRKWGDIEGCESKLCFDFKTQQIIPFENKQLDYFVTDVLPFRDLDGQIKLRSFEYYPAGSWKTIYEPVKLETALGKRKAEDELTK